MVSFACRQLRSYSGLGGLGISGGSGAGGSSAGGSGAGGSGVGGSGAGGSGAGGSGDGSARPGAGRQSTATAAASASSPLRRAAFLAFSVSDAIFGRSLRALTLVAELECLRSLRQQWQPTGVYHELPHGFVPVDHTAWPVLCKLVEELVRQVVENDLNPRSNEAVRGLLGPRSIVLDARGNGRTGLAREHDVSASFDRSFDQVIQRRALGLLLSGGQVAAVTCGGGKRVHSVLSCYAKSTAPMMARGYGAGFASVSSPSRSTAVGAASDAELEEQDMAPGN